MPSTGASTPPRSSRRPRLRRPRTSPRPHRASRRSWPSPPPSARRAAPSRRTRPSRTATAAAPPATTTTSRAPADTGHRSAAAPTTAASSDASRPRRPTTTAAPGTATTSAADDGAPVGLVVMGALVLLALLLWARALVGVGAALARALAPRDRGGRAGARAPRGRSSPTGCVSAASRGGPPAAGAAGRRAPGDVDALLDDPDVLRFTRLPVAPPPDYARQWLDRYEAGRRDGTREAFAALDDDGRFLGLALAVGIESDAREVELGYIVAPAARGRGFAVAMLAELTRWAFAELKPLRITLIIDVENAVSSRVAERCGYVRRGDALDPSQGRRPHRRGDLVGGCRRTPAKGFDERRRGALAPLRGAQLHHRGRGCAGAGVGSPGARRFSAVRVRFATRSVGDPAGGGRDRRESSPSISPTPLGTLRGVTKHARISRRKTHAPEDDGTRPDHRHLPSLVGHAVCAAHHRQRRADDEGGYDPTQRTSPGMARLRGGEAEMPRPRPRRRDRGGCGRRSPSRPDRAATAWRRGRPRSQGPRPGGSWR